MSALELCNATIVKSVAMNADGWDTDMVDQLILMASRQVEEYLNRATKSEAFTESFTIRPGQKIFSLRHYPVSSITSVGVDGGDAIDSDYYRVDGHQLLFLYGPPISDSYSDFPKLAVVGVGGMADTTSSFVAATGYPDIGIGVARYVTFLYKRTVTIDKNSISGGMVSESLLPVELPAWLKEICSPHRRLC